MRPSQRAVKELEIASVACSGLAHLGAGPPDVSCHNLEVVCVGLPLSLGRHLPLLLPEAVTPED